MNILNRKFQSDSDEESQKPEIFSQSNNLYTPSKDLFAVSPPQDIVIDSNQDDIEDLAFLSSKKTFDDFFMSTCDEVLNCSSFVKDQFENFEKLLQMELDENWELKFNKPFGKIYVKFVIKN